jgi:4-amino-4-deoxy-L-arabinose transferase-like glycosyltransferase
MSFSWETRPAPSLTLGRKTRTRTFALRLPYPELLGLIALAGTLNLWALSRNGWANEYYAAAVRSMSSSWHNFLFGSLDASGVMTVDKPPLALWIQSLSVRVFGYHSLSILVPQALIGVVTVVLTYDLVRRRFGRLGGFVAGLALALTPITVAISRHNNPDALLILCCVAALWCTVRALETAPARSQTRWLVLAGVAVGLGFETKMAVALMVVPGIVAAWLWIAPADGNPTHPRLHALRQLLPGGVAMVLVGGAWPLLVELTPAGDRPWISGTSDNKILSLISEYNGVGRIDGQTGGPGGVGGGGSVFGGTAGPLRLLNSALGGQAGWLLGFALVSGIGILVASRLRRVDPRSGWLIAVGGALLVTGVVFSSAKGIFHPYYVSLLAPLIAMLTGAGAAQLLKGGLNERIVGPLAVVAGVATELAVLSRYPGELTWLAPILIAVGVLAALALAAFAERRVRLAALGAVLAALLVAPGAWAVDTLGHATSGTFPAGGPESAATGGGPAGFGGGPGGRGFAGGRPGLGGRPGAGGIGGVQLFGSGGTSQSGSTVQQGVATGAGGQAGAPPTGGAGFAAGGGRPGGAGFGGGAGGGGEASLTQALTYIHAHDDGTLAVESQSSAATAIVDKDADVAGIGGFSGRESTVSISWLADEVAAGKVRWVLGGEDSGGGLPGDTRKGSSVAIAAAAKVCRKVTLPSATSTVSGTSGTSALFGTRTGVPTSSTVTLYDCQGRAAVLRTQESGR